MFFGLEVKSNQNSAKPIVLNSQTRISQAVLEPTKNGKKEPVSVLVEHENKQFLVCVLDPNLAWQSPLDLMFEPDSEIKFFIKGQGTVHLTGYKITNDLEDQDLFMSDDSSVDLDEQEEDEEDEGDEEDEEEEKAKQLAFGSTSKKQKLTPAKTNGAKSSPAKKKQKTTNGIAKPNMKNKDNEGDKDDDDDESDDEDFDVDFSSDDDTESSDDGVSDDEEDTD